LGVFGPAIRQLLPEGLDVPLALQGLVQFRLEAAHPVLRESEFLLDLLQPL
jgi:hypothetical protein